MHALIHLLMVMDVLSTLKIEKWLCYKKKNYVLSSAFDSCTKKWQLVWLFISRNINLFFTSVYSVNRSVFLVYTIKTKVQNGMKISYNTETKNHTNRKFGSVRFIFGMVFRFGFQMHRVTINRFPKPAYRDLLPRW